MESGELRWPPDNMDMEEDEEDLFLEQCIPPANIEDWGDEEEEEETSVILNQQQGLTLIGEFCSSSSATLCSLRPCSHYGPKSVFCSIWIDEYRIS